MLDILICLNSTHTQTQNLYPEHILFYSLRFSKWYCENETGNKSVGSGRSAEGLIDKLYGGSGWLAGSNFFISVWKSQLQRRKVCCGHLASWSLSRKIIIIHQPPANLLSSGAQWGRARSFLRPSSSPPQSEELRKSGLGWIGMVSKRWGISISDIPLRV